MDPTGLYWLGARYYDPMAGRFLTPDPLGHSASMDLYSFADGDPVNHFDADGRFGKSVVGNLKPLALGIGDVMEGGSYYKSYLNPHSGWSEVGYDMGYVAAEATKQVALFFATEGAFSLMARGLALGARALSAEVRIGEEALAGEAAAGGGAKGAFGMGVEMADFAAAGGLPANASRITGATSEGTFAASETSWALVNASSSARSEVGASWQIAASGLTRSTGSAVIGEAGILAAEGTGATTWQQYELAIQNVYGGPASFGARQYQAVVNGKVVNGVADNITTIGGKSVAVEAKFVNNWTTSIRNPMSSVGGRPFAVDAQQQMLFQARAYSAAFDQVIYHSNSPELIQYYSSVFKNADIQNLLFILTK